MAAAKYDKVFKRIQALFLGALPIGKVTEDHVIGQLEQASVAFEKGLLNVDKPVKVKEGQTMLHIASTHRKEKVMLWLLERKANPNLQDERGNTPVHYAAIDPLYSPAKRRKKNMRQVITLRVLIEDGGSLHIRNKGNEAPLDILQKQKFNMTLLRLGTKRRRKKAVPDQGEERAGKIQYTKLKKLFQVMHTKPAVERTIAALINSKNVVRLVKSGHCNINAAPSGDGNTFLHMAVQLVKPALVTALCEVGAMTNTQNAIGETALFLACKKGKISMVRTLLEHEADPHLTTYVRRESSYDAAKRYPAILKLLNEYGGKVVKRKKKIISTDNKQALQAAVTDAALSTKTTTKTTTTTTTTKKSVNSPAPVKKGLSAAAQALRATKLAKMQSDQALNLNELWGLLDYRGDGELNPLTVAALHRDLHGCLRSDDEIQSMMNKMKCRKKNMLRIFELLTVSCEREQDLNWDFDVQDDADSGYLSYEPARRVWDYNSVDSRQKSADFNKVLLDDGFEDAMSYLSYKAHLLKPPNMKDYTT